MKLNSKVVIRVDCNKEIGSGHATRSMTIASELAKSGLNTIFVVSDEESADFFDVRGLHPVILQGDYRNLGVEDGRNLARLACTDQRTVVLVDSYAVSDNFFSSFRLEAPNIPIAYMDDMYSYATGSLEYPKMRDVDLVVNYAFGLNCDEYVNAYENTGATLALGSQYAPIRPVFVSAKRECAPKRARNVLITTGATNPDRILERIVESVVPCAPDAKFNVVVGSSALFGMEATDNILIHEGLTDLSPIMKGCDIAISAAGSTLYELCASGVPTIAIALFDNHYPNLRGIDGAGLLAAALYGNISHENLSKTFAEVNANVELRDKLSKDMRLAIDGKGASRISEIIKKLNRPIRH